MDANMQPPIVPPQMPPAPAQQAGPRRTSSGAVAGWIVGGVALCLILLVVVFFCGTCFIMSTVFRSGEFAGSGVGLIEINGVLSSNASGFGGGTSSQSVVEQLHRAVENRRIKALLIRIDSPGGTPAAAEEIYQEIGRTAQAKPVIVSIGDLGASAAYYLASAANVIYALPDSDVGSIGVILEIPNIEGLNDKIGVRWYVFTQGQYKDIGSPLRPPTPEEAAILQQQMQVAYDHFIKDVATGRHMDEARVRQLATGLTFPGTEAKALGLIDEIGNYRDALNRAGRMGGIKGEVRAIPLMEGGAFGLFSELLTTFKDISNNLNKLVRGSGAADQEQPQER
ncbi:MAG: signal peptide peptidase SppA [Candidatus Geothermincolia bacterium]